MPLSIQIYHGSQFYWWRKPGENHQPVTSHWQTLSHNVVSSTPRHERGLELTTLVHLLVEDHEIKSYIVYLPLQRIFIVRLYQFKLIYNRPISNLTKGDKQFPRGGKSIYIQKRDHIKTNWNVKINK
jgi:hypothetical protein